MEGTTNVSSTQAFFYSLTSGAYRAVDMKIVSLCLRDDAGTAHLMMRKRGRISCAVTQRGSPEPHLVVRVAGKPSLCSSVAVILASAQPTKAYPLIDSR